MTFGTRSAILEGYDISSFKNCELDSGRFVVAYPDGANSSRLTFKVGSVSGTTISWGTAAYNNSYQGVSIKNIKKIDTDKSVFNIILLIH